jgi:hypothetical protein
VDNSKGGIELEDDKSNNVETESSTQSIQIIQISEANTNTENNV